MAQCGDEKDCGGYTRRYYDSKLDEIISADGEYFYRDKINHVTYECKGDFIDLLLTNQLGDVVDMYDDEDEDEIWDEEDDEEIEDD